MSHSVVEAETFVDEAQYALKLLYEGISQRQQALDSICEQLESLERAENLEQSLFINDDQFSHNANYLYARYRERVAAIAAQKKALSSHGGQTQQLQKLLARIGATEEAMRILGGAVLQIGKQTLSYRFGTNPFISTARKVGQQSVIEVIWEGRNHAQHWEENNPRPAVLTMLQRLQSELGTQIQPNQNNSLEILNALGWNGVEDVLTDLKALVT